MSSSRRGGKKDSVGGAKEDEPQAFTTESQASIVAAITKEIRALSQNSLTTVVETLSNLVKTQQSEIHDIKDSIGKLITENVKLEEEKNNMKHRIDIYEARVERLERTVNEQNEEILDLKCRSMRDNLVFNNVREFDKEDTREVVSDFIADVMKVDKDLIQIDRAHRTGPRKIDGTRSIVVKFANSDSKSNVIKSSPGLKNTDFSVFEQFPPEIEERRKKLLKVMKEKKSVDSNAKCRLVVDKLFINGQKYIDEDRNDRNNVFSEKDVEDAKTVKLVHSQPILDRGSTFVGHAAMIKSTNSVRSVLLKAYENKLVAGAHHNIYAYRIRENGQLRESSCDDKEHGAGKQLLNLLQEKKLENVMVITTRWYGGLDLGRDRFVHIKEASNQALDVLKL